ncbi:TlpA family protein disulfide reductase [Pseudemcibacter aquimaris]|uniref:TlpA family protein disulfide reductase n=1 Tax=Pseudemcibacter aquimaris TaxID=2857064 RepID=UPI00201129C0|nr:TlpA disulfide reductase family protein [Pseudemcibacter aquimaris]MCC3859825.1 TlpA family protein disulfide reductase [Pseudemcibacter aquimaris]WDU57157.1 TlpA family protein disulfide reductase [Pseudemcibacter aquimaris]
MRYLLTLFIIVFSIYTVSAAETNLSVGDKIPEKLGVNLNGEKVSASDHKGKVLVVSFWATWCPPCRRELPVIDNLQKLAGKENLSVIAVNYGEKGRVYRRFTEALGEVNLTFTHDKRGRIGKKDFGVGGIPHMVIANHEGIIEHIHIGYGDDTINNLANEINTLLQKRREAIASVQSSLDKDVAE